MKFLVLMAEEDHFGRWDRSGDADRQAVFDCFRQYTEAVRGRGAVLGGEALASTAEARTLRPGRDRPATEGPYAETVEQTGGFYLVELPDRDTAVELARLLPPAYTVEVRPIIDVPFE
ncbi:MAG: YCII-related protein [Nocardioides sp.]|nr:YCII-related protein [Nocardioides sp.]